VGFLASVGLILLNALGRAALVHQVRSAEQFGMVVLKGGWLAGKEHLWRVFAIRLLLGLPLAVLLLVGMLPPIVAQVVAARQERIEVVIPAVLTMQVLLVGCLVPALCLVALLSIPLRILQRLAVRACVLESLNVRQSIRRGWQIAREHPSPLTLVWLILLGTGIAVAVLASLPLVLIGVPLMTIILLVVLASPVAFAALTLAAGLLLWLLAAACGSVVETFASALWTLAYRELHGMGLTGEEGHFASTHR